MYRELNADVKQSKAVSQTSTLKPEPKKKPLILTYYKPQAIYSL